MSLTVQLPCFNGLSNLQHAPSDIGLKSLVASEDLAEGPRPGSLHLTKSSMSVFDHACGRLQLLSILLPGFRTLLLRALSVSSQ